MVACRACLDFKVNGFSAVHANVRGKALDAGIAGTVYVPLTWWVARLGILAGNGVRRRRTRIGLDVVSHRSRLTLSGVGTAAIKPKAQDGEEEVHEISSGIPRMDDPSPHAR
jgi:hypothetical protein